MQAGHELSLTAAALILVIGGGLILLRAGLDRRNATAPAVIGPAPTNVLSEPAVATPSPVDLIQRFALWVTVGLSIGAATIHLVAGPEHVQELGGLGLGFYWAALFQLLLAIALLRRPGSRSLAWLGIGGNVALIGAWAWSRTMGLPGVAGGPEMMGVADGTTVLLQIALVALLAVRLGRFDTRFAAAHSAASIRSFTTAGLVAGLSIVALSTTIAIADVSAGHPGGDPGGQAPGQHPLDDGTTH